MKNIWLIALISIALGIISCSKDDDKETTVYTVTFDTDGGSPVPTVQRVEAGGIATVPATNPGKTGYIFMYWYLNGTSAAYNFQTPVNNNLTLFAKWQEETTAQYWQVAWELNGGAWPSDDNHATQVVKGGTLAEPAQPTKPGYSFDGWYKENTLTNKVNFPYDVSNLTSNFTLYAKWKEDGGEVGEYLMFTSIADLKKWFNSQSEKKTYKVGLKGVNLDINNGWGDLGIAINNSSANEKYIELDLRNCTGTAIPDGYWKGNTLYAAFVNNEILRKIILPNGLKTIGEYTFYYCKRLNAVEFPGSLETIKYKAFLGCDALNNLVFPESLKTIENAAFNSCDYLTSVTFPTGLQTIGEKAFEFCGLETVSIPRASISIGSSAFAFCDKLTTVTLPEGIKTVEGWFYSCESLTSINIPSTVTSIGNSAFSGCKALTSINIPNSVTSIGNSVFSDCESLSSLTLPKDLKNIGESAFHGCTFTSIIFPENVESIGKYVLGSSKITEIVLLPTTPPVLSGNLYSSTPFAFQIQVPAASVNAYKAAAGWRSYASKIIAN